MATADASPRPAARRLLVSIESGPHPGTVPLARELAAALAERGALAVEPSLPDHDTSADGVLCLALGRLQNNFRALARCPAPPAAGEPPQVVIVTRGFYADAIYATDPTDAAVLRAAHEQYGRRGAVDAHLCVTLDLPMDEMHRHAIEAGVWPRCTVADLSRLPERFSEAARSYRLASRPAAVLILDPGPHFDCCEVDFDNTASAIASTLLKMTRALAIPRA